MKNHWSKIWLIGLPVVMICFLIVASFADYSIAQAIYNPNNIFSNIFSAIGKMPGFIIAAVSFAILAQCAFYKNDIKPFFKWTLTIIYFIGGIAMSTFSFFDISEIIFETDKLWQYLSSGIAGILTFNVIFWIITRIREKEVERYNKWAVYCIVCVVAFLISTLALKSLWGRLRYEDIVEGAGEFYPWYIIQKADGSSFPSGHTIMACGAFLLVPLTKFNEKASKNIFWLRLCPLSFVILTMLARMSAGNHFLSDVVMSSILAFVITMIANLCFWGKKGDNIAFSKDGLWSKLC